MIKANQPKIILGIESSCDETAAAVCLKDKDGVHILSNVVASSASLQAKYGGVIPEQAAREQLKSIIPVIQEALRPFDKLRAQGEQSLDAIAVTYGPGLIGSLLVGVETAKVLATIWQKPLIPVNHLLGHFYANWITGLDNHLPGVPQAQHHLEGVMPKFPCLGLLVSGGHTDLVLFSDHGKFKYLGGTRDDAAGECFDKCARLLGLPYPGGPNISRLAESAKQANLAEKGNPKTYSLPRPMLNSGDLDFSFSGLKTAVFNLLKYEGGLSPNAANFRRAKRAYPRRKPQDACVSEQMSGIADRDIPDLCASVEDAITDVLVKKTVTAIQTHHVDQLIIAGGVAANKILAQKLTHRVSEIIPHARIFIPPASLCTDNAAMIATAAFYNYQPIDPLKLQANPNLSLS